MSTEGQGLTYSFYILAEWEPIYTIVAVANTFRIILFVYGPFVDLRFWFFRIIDNISHW